MRPSSILIAFATLLPLACSNGGPGDGGSGVCGGSESTCASVTDCCAGFECEAGKCAFVGGNGGNGNGGGSSTSKAGSSSGTGTNSSGSSGTQGSSSGSGTLGSSGGTTHSSTGGTTHSSTGGTTVKSSSGGSSSGASGGSSPDLCALCDSTNCAGVNDLCVCDPDDANCNNVYCAGSCLNPNTGGGNQALCPIATTCVAATDSQGSNTDYVCLPSPGTCIKGGSSSGGSSGGSTSHSSSSGGSSGGSSPDLCFMCGTSSSSSSTSSCSATTDLCVCDPDDVNCTDGFCAGNCTNGGVADQALCPRGTTCIPTLDYQTESITEFVCYPADGTCLDAGV